MKLLINGKDALKTWGAFLQEGSENNLFLPANNKPIVTNKSRLEHGKRVVIDEVYIDERDVILTFCIQANSRVEFKQKYKSFVEELRKGLTRLEYDSEVYKFLLKDFMELDFFNRLGTLSVRFNEPNPNDRD